MISKTKSESLIWYLTRDKLSKPNPCEWLAIVVGRRFDHYWTNKMCFYNTSVTFVHGSRSTCNVLHAYGCCWISGLLFSSWCCWAVLSSVQFFWSRPDFRLQHFRPQLTCDRQGHGAAACASAASAGLWDWIGAGKRLARREDACVECATLPNQ